jgi:hypothetical protein
MLSLILSRIFSICFGLAILTGIIAVGIQFTESRSGISLGNGWQIGFVRPGLEVKATGFNQRALPADTSIKIVYRDSNNNITGSGMLGLPERRGEAFINRMIESKKASGDQARIDTFYTVMGQMKPGDDSGPEYQVAETPGASTSFLPDSGIISRSPLVFADAASAKRYFLLHTVSRENRINGNTQSTETLRIQPANQRERMGFALHELVKYGCISLLFLFLARLFRNFSKKEFFTPPNIRLLRKIGGLMLAISLVSLLLYFLFLQHMQPVKFVMDQNAEISSMMSYNLSPDINWMMITSGISLLVLARIFKDGLEMKEKELFIF